MKASALSQRYHTRQFDGFELKADLLQRFQRLRGACERSLVVAAVSRLTLEAAREQKERELHQNWARVPENGRSGSGMEFSMILLKNAAFAGAAEQPGLLQQLQPRQLCAQKSLIRRVSKLRCSKETYARSEILAF
jgi:hypothetical protein